MNSFVVIAHNVRSAHNVGSIMRTSDGCGVRKIFLTGYTPEPATENALYVTKAQKEIAKTALGAEKSVSWEKLDSINPVLQALRQEGYMIVALEQYSASIDYRKITIPKGLIALVVGNEVDGVDVDLLKQCDVVMEIPMRGEKNSLNVSVAFGVAAFEIASTLGN